MKKTVDMLVGKHNFINNFTRCVHKWWKSRSVCDTWTHFPCSWCSVKFIFNIVHLLSCYFTHHIFWIGSPKRERKACDNHSWLCHVQSCVVWSPFCVGLVVSWSVIWNQEQRLKDWSPIYVDHQALQFVFLISRLMFIHFILIFGILY